MREKLTGAQRVKHRRTLGAEAAGTQYSLRCRNTLPNGKGTWGPWGAPDEYVYGVGDKFVLATGNVNDTEWVQKCSWQRRVDSENRIQEEKREDMKDGTDEAKVKKMKEFLQYSGQSAGLWKSVSNSQGLEDATPSRSVPPATPAAARPWLQNVKGPMKETLDYLQDIRESTAGVTNVPPSRRLCHVSPPRWLPLHPFAEAAAMPPPSTQAAALDAKSGRHSVPLERSRISDRTQTLRWRCPQGTSMGDAIQTNRPTPSREKLVHGDMPSPAMGHEQARPFFQSWTGYFSQR